MVDNDHISTVTLNASTLTIIDNNKESIDYRIACNMQLISELKAEIKELKHETDELLLNRKLGLKQVERND